MRLRFTLAGLLAATIEAQSTTSITAASSTDTSITTITNATATVPTGPYISYSNQITLTSATSTTATASSSGTVTGTGTSKTGSTFLLVGTTLSTSSSNATATSTTTAAVATNTQACNGYTEFCDRKWSNITYVCAHNSAFDIANNAASNQQYGIVAQLNDGIRMIQGETHYVNDTIYSCHTSCDLLNAGTLESELATVATWVEQNPYDVVTILLVNSDYVAVTNYTAPILNAGLGPYLYYPPKVPMTLDDWPTLSEMILTGKRVVVFMDYEANQTAVPYILDEFSQMFETPFSPTDPSFPCTEQRPPGLSDADAANYLYLANHNLNVDITLLGLSLLIPNTADLVDVNAVSGNSSLGLMANTCTSDWGRPPNFLLVDYYNKGNGSVFEVAAQMNNVTYTAKCCGYDQTLPNGASLGRPAYLTMALFSVSAAFILFL